MSNSNFECKAFASLVLIIMGIVAVNLVLRNAVKGDGKKNIWTTSIKTTKNILKDTLGTRLVHI